MPENITPAYLNGGYSTADGDKMGDSVSEAFGRFRNNMSGKTAENMFNSAEAEKARVFNSAEAQKNRDWETMMSNTALQRQVADAKAAGINPASLGGDGASTPQGFAASGPSAQSTASGSHSGIGSILKSVISLALFKKFSNTAKAASTASEIVSRTSAEAASAKQALHQANLEAEGKRLQRLHEKEALQRAKKYADEYGEIKPLIKRM